MILPWQQPWWWGTALVLILGPCVVVGVAALSVRLVRSVVWQRALWRVAILGLLALVAAEATGVSAGIVLWLRASGMLPSPALADVGPPAADPTSLGPRSFAGPVLDEPLLGDDFAPRHERGQGVGCTNFSFRGPEIDALGKADPPRKLKFVHPTPTSDERDREVVSACVATAAGPASAFAPHGSAGDTGYQVSGSTAQATDPARSAAASHVLSDGWGYGLALVWGVGAVLLFARILWTRWLLHLVRRRQVRCDQPAIRQRVDRLAGRLGVGRRVEVLESSRLAAPLAFGVLRPVIVLPAGFAEDFDASQQDAMLAHELAHLAASDPAWQLLADLAAAWLWWHPLAWWTRRQWRAAGELAADEACLVVPQGAHTLAACLVLLARRLDSSPRWAGLAIAGPGLRSALGKRVERLLDLSVRTWRPPTRGGMRVVTATVPVALLLVAVSCTAWARTRVPATEGATTMRLFLDCWRQSLAAVTLAAVLGPASGGTSPVIAGEGPHDPPLIKAEREGGDRPAAKEERKEGDRPAARAERREGDRPAAKEERRGEKHEPRRDGEPRKPEVRGERERPREGGEKEEAGRREMAQRRAHLQEEAMQIRRKLESLKPDQDADARELKGALERIEKQLRELQGPAPNRERIHARLEELKAAIHKAREAGRADEAERLEREGRELMRMVEAGRGDRPAERPQGEDVQRRLQHLRVAIENLRAAGLNEQAEALARDAERFLHQRQPDRPRDAPAAAPPQLERAVQELRAQVQQMHQQMEEIRHHLKALSEKR